MRIWRGLMIADTITVSLKRVRMFAFSRRKVDDEVVRFSCIAEPAH